MVPHLSERHQPLSSCPSGTWISLGYSWLFFPSQTPGTLDLYFLISSQISVYCHGHCLSSGLTSHLALGDIFQDTSWTPTSPNAIPSPFRQATLRTLHISSLWWVKREMENVYCVDTRQGSAPGALWIILCSFTTILFYVCGHWGPERLSSSQCHIAAQQEKWNLNPSLSDSHYQVFFPPSNPKLSPWYIIFF